MACYVFIEKVEEKQQLQPNYQEKKKKTKINKTKSMLITVSFHFMLL